VNPRPDLDRWLADVDDVLERTMPEDQCVHDPDGWTPAIPIAPPPTPLGVEADTPTTLRRVVGVALRPIKTATAWWEGWTL
jgi:hypothetical protein